MANFQVLNLVRFRVRFQISILKKWRNLVGAGNSTVLMCLFQNYFLDDRLIKLVRENSAIYDVSHPHYRRTPVRMAIWDNIARELGAPCKSIEALQCILFSGVLPFYVLSLLCIRRGWLVFSSIPFFFRWFVCLCCSLRHSSSSSSV